MNNYLKQLSTTRKVVYLFIVFAFLFHFIPYFVSGEAAYVRIHDTLEGEWIWLNTLVQEGMAMNYDMEARIERVMNGIPRFMYPSGLSLNVLLIYLFGSFPAYVISYIMIRTLAFIGSYFLLRHYILKEKDDFVMAALIALLFSFIPFFTALGLTVAGQPLLILAFLDFLKGKNRWWQYTIVLLFPFYSSIIWAAPFVSLILLVLAAYHYFKNRQFSWRFTTMFLLMNTLFLLANYHLLYAMFFSDIPAHREEYNPFLEWQSSVSANILETLYIFLLGHYHVGMFFTLPILLLAWFRRKDKRIWWLLMLIFIISIINGFYIYLVPVLNAIHPILISFVIKRMNVALPFLWILVLAYSTTGIIRYPAWRKFALFVLANMLIISIFTNDELLHNYRNLTGHQKKPGYSAYVAENLFREIDRSISLDKASYRVVSLGLNPVIAQYNGFFTSDGLQSIYPLSQKHAFRDIMKDELKKDSALSNYFLGWGNRCYLFSSELGFHDEAFMISKKSDIRIKNLQIDPDKLKDLQVRFIFSAVRIDNFNDLNLHFFDTFEAHSGFWRIHVYEIK